MNHIGNYIGSSEGNSEPEKTAFVQEPSDSQTVTVTVGDQKAVYPAGTRYITLAGDYAGEADREVLLVRENNGLRELCHKIRDGAQIKLLTFQDEDGRKTYVRSLELMMLKAADAVSGRESGYAVTVHFIVGGGLYCTLKDPSLLTQDWLDCVSAKMREYQAAALPIRKINVSTARAREIFHQRQMFDKEELFRYRLSSRTNLYDLDGYIDYYYGYMAYDTSVLTHFGLRLYEEGFVLTFEEGESAGSTPGTLSPAGLSDAENKPVETFSPDRKLFQVQMDSLRWGERIDVRDVGDLDDLIVSGQQTQLILTQEASHEMEIARIAQRIVSDERYRLVMIAGPSSSGKTTFSHRLAAALSVYGVKPHPIPIDNYYLDREFTPRDENGNYDFECLEALDVEQFNKDMSALIAGEKVRLPVFNFKTGKREYKKDFLQIGPRDILVIEGIHGLNDRLSYALPKESKFKIYISALTQLNIDDHNRIPTTDGRLIRRIVRDARTRGTSAAETIAMWPSVRRGEERHIFPFQESADVMFNSALIYELAVLRLYAQPLLLGIEPSDPAWSEARRLLKFLEYFVAIPADAIPVNSLVREFVGGSCFNV